LTIARPKKAMPMKIVIVNSSRSTPRRV